MAVGVGGSVWWEPLGVAMLVSLAYVAVVWRLRAWREVLSPEWNADVVRATGWPERPVSLAANVLWAAAIASVVVSWLR